MPLAAIALPVVSLSFGQDSIMGTNRSGQRLIKKRKTAKKIATLAARKLAGTAGKTKPAGTQAK